MKFHVKAALDVIRKGLDPTFPHKDLGNDGMLLAQAPALPPSLKPTATVISVSEVPPVVVVPVSEPVQEESAVVASIPAETIPESTTTPPEPPVAQAAPEDVVPSTINEETAAQPKTAKRTPKAVKSSDK